MPKAVKSAVRREPKMKHSYMIVTKRGNLTTYVYRYSLKEVRDHVSSILPGSVVDVYKQTNEFVQRYEVKK